MAILETDESNIIDAEATNWRLIVYPAIVILVIALGGTSYYFYQQHQRDEVETKARAALVQAKTPADFLKVASDFPETDQATLALLRSADASYTQHDYDAAIATYHKVADNDKVDPVLRDTAALGIAGAQDSAGKTDDALASYLSLARRRDNTPFAPYAFYAVAHIYEQRGDKANEIETLSEAAGLDPNSFFTRQAQYRLKQFSDEQKAATPPPAPGVNGAPAAQAPTTIPLTPGK
jgi:predicted negative regulator of RcsB-dependent stress response